MRNKFDLLMMQKIDRKLGIAPLLEGEATAENGVGMVVDEEGATAETGVGTGATAGNAGREVETGTGAEAETETAGGAGTSHAWTSSAGIAAMATDASSPTSLAAGDAISLTRNSKRMRVHPT